MIEIGTSKLNKAWMVSVCCLTYNHEKLIKQALKGFAMQKTSFPFEIVIHDDASTDGTVKVLKNFASQNPGKVRLLLQEKNQFSIDGVYPINNLYKAAKGKYIAECDGDDYWTDPYKLQKQVIFLEANPDFVMCHHDYQIHNNGIERVKIRDKGKDYAQEELIGYALRGHGIGHCTKMWRNIYNEKTKTDFAELVGDYSLNVLMGMYGKAKYLDSVRPSVYRRLHGNNSWSSLSSEDMRNQIKDLYKHVHEFMLKKGNPKWIEIRAKFLAEKNFPSPPQNPPVQSQEKLVTVPHPIELLNRALNIPYAGARRMPPNWR